MTSASKTGPLTRTELEAIWKSVTDPEYSRSFVERGEGQGYEAHTQAMVQLERVSQGIDRTTQANYVKPWSGQTSEPASGGRFSTVTLTLAREAHDWTQSIILPAGTQVEEVVIDFGRLGGEEVATGRRYLLTKNTGFVSGQAGPIEILAIADRPGEGFDNPLPGTLRRIVQVGVGLSNEGASVVPGVITNSLVMGVEPDVITHAQIGQYVAFVAGANQGKICRIVGIIPPDQENPITGGTALLEATQVFRVDSFSGTFIEGEQLIQTATSSSSILILFYGQYMIAQRQTGAITAGPIVEGAVSGAITVLNSIEDSGDLVAETNTANWRVIGWSELGITVTNQLSPVGGRSAVLDEIGYERMVYRGVGESDDDYRERVANVSDIVSPNAIRRIANKMLVPYGYEAILREVGYPLFRGFFYDGDPSKQDVQIAFAYDLTRVDQRFMVQLDYTEFRAFFLLEIPRIGLGEFGFAYDLGGVNFYDAAPSLSFLDGYPITGATILKRLWNAINEAKAGGVGFDFVHPRDPGPLPT